MWKLHSLVVLWIKLTCKTQNISITLRPLGPTIKKYLRTRAMKTSRIMSWFTSISTRRSSGRDYCSTEFDTSRIVRVPRSWTSWSPPVSVSCLTSWAEALLGLMHRCPLLGIGSLGCLRQYSCSWSIASGSSGNNIGRHFSLLWKLCCPGGKKTFKKNSARAGSVNCFDSWSTFAWVWLLVSVFPSFARRFSLAAEQVESCRILPVWFPSTWRGMASLGQASFRRLLWSTRAKSQVLLTDRLLQVLFTTSKRHHLQMSCCIPKNNAVPFFFFSENFFRRPH